MDTGATTLWRPLAAIALLAFALLFSGAARAERASALSRWLSQEVIPEMVDILSRHPRFAGQPVQIDPAEPNGLANAIATTLHNNFATSDTIATVRPPLLLAGQVPLPDSVDDLDCVAPTTSRTGLQVSVKALSGKRGSVELALFDAGDATAYWRRWQWQGAFSQAEREALSAGTAMADADGSLKFPWPHGAVQEAALSLSNELACDLRSQLLSRVELQFGNTGQLPAELLDVGNASRHLLGNFREIGLSGGEADFQVDVRVEPFHDNIWQLWLTGTPRRGGYDPVQAVTYIRRPVGQQGNSVASPSVVAAAPVAVTAPGDPALKYLDVHMLDVAQTDTRFSSAQLRVDLQLVNRGQWPIQYAFSLSGGHYLDCIPGPEYYRHDRYGYMEGELPPGQSLVRQLVVEGVQHSPTPWFGPRKCAGFKDLEGFENFAGKGFKVTEFVRWRM